ncbi:MAG: alpha-amylase family glycosyl hydrolase [Flavobacteriaceae bacterium]|nr:alpha-amylase family glycosyl hydrolase [Flavobacteriaceae bacterium]
MHSLRLIQQDPYLKPYEQQIINRIEWYQNTKEYIERNFGSLERFATAHLFFGFNYDKDKKGWWFRDWLPNADFVSLIGDFNDWNRSATPLRKGNFGAWEVFLPDEDFKDKLIPGSKVKMHVHGRNGALDRIPAFIREVVQNQDHSFSGVFSGESSFEWKNKFDASQIKTPFIYEAHVGMATEEERVGTYREFAENILPRIKELGYNCIQLMAIMEHPYYGSFGYQVSNFFAPTSRFGTPDDLRYLVDTAHGMGIAVILDVVHSHAVKNRDEGLAELDGTELYFNGWHPDWDSRLFDYSKLEVKRFLASNLVYWMQEFQFDGFRFDGVTSMLYHHFGHISFTEYSSYFQETNNDAIIYLQLANELIHELNPGIISICEDMSGMPGACRPVLEGGLGFDYRLAMGIPDFWFNTLETKRDEDWHMGDLYWQLINRRENEKTIAYAESHDQALVGDKTIAFWLMDAEMYTGMSVFTQSLNIDRGISLHKMIRFITAVLGGEGYMNFMGNEFGHPEWIDFPRAENAWSYKYARRQWSLPDTDHLKYKFLEQFDKDMLRFLKKYNILEARNSYKIAENNAKGILIFEKGELLFLFNFGVESNPDFELNPGKNGKFTIIFSSDDGKYGGFDRPDITHSYISKENKLLIYLPSRSFLVLKKK